MTSWNILLVPRNNYKKGFIDFIDRLPPFPKTSHKNILCYAERNLQANYLFSSVAWNHLNFGQPPVTESLLDVVPN